jgi:hypothetical protein
LTPNIASDIPHNDERPPVLLFISATPPVADLDPPRPAHTPPDRDQSVPPTCWYLTRLEDRKEGGDGDDRLWNLLHVQRSWTTIERDASTRLWAEGVVVLFRRAEGLSH